MAPINVPPSLKKIKVFLTRATELDRDKSNPESRVVAYNCRQYAVLTGIPLATDGPAKECLGELLNQLESEKAAMSVFSKSEHWMICHKVADKVFEKADAEDRGGVANKGTAKTFYTAGTFYDILQQFYDEAKTEAEGEDDEIKARMEEEEQRRVYSKWKATEILNAVKEGRTPTPGGYQSQEELEDFAMPLVGAPVDNGSHLPSISEDAVPPAAPSMNGELPPAPSMPTSWMEPVDNYEERQNNLRRENNKTETTTNEVDTIAEDLPPPVSYNGIELSLSGQPTPTVEDVNSDDDSDTEEIFVPGATKSAADEMEKNDASNIFVADVPTPMAPPPPYPDTTTSTREIPPPVASRPLPPVPVAPPASSTSSSSGMFSGMFGHKSSGDVKLTKAQMSDAVELTKFALAALQKGDGDLGRERLEQALGLWRR